MKQSLSAFISMILLFYSTANAQSQISGRIVSTTGESVSNASVSLGSGEGIVTDDNGNFKFRSTKKLPVTIVVSAVGFATKSVEINSEQKMEITMAPTPVIELPVVISTTLVPVAIIESPTSVERYGSKAIANSPATSYIDIAWAKKGIDLTTSSLNFKTISTRGFNGSGSTRVNQIVEGMDNQAPGLNFFIGNFSGLTDLDVDNIEILPGASSALYGPGGMNGTIVISGKSPFKNQGLTIQARQGVMGIDKSQRGQATSFSDYSLRWAKAFNNKFAFKVGGQFMTATDWLANDSSNYQRLTGKLIPGTRQTDPNYDGVNVYGDETSVDIRSFIPPGLFPGNGPINVSRTGYKEIDVIDPKTQNIKLSGELDYKLNKNLEAQLLGYWATGNTVYTGDNRYALKGIKLGQYKVELKSKNWFLRSYTTQENAGEAYSATVSSQIFNEGWKRSYDPNNVAGSWYPQYITALLNGYLGVGMSIQDAHNYARSVADVGRPVPGSAQFNQIFDKVRKTPIPAGGLFQETSQLWMTQGQYNFSDKIKFAEIIIGGNLKKYILNSKGTLFIDTAKAINFNEAGAFLQATKKLFQNNLTLSAAGRYDKNEDFKGHFTPRVTAVIRIAKDNDLRMSYQTAYRFPSTQQKYIRLNVGGYTLLGGLPWVMDFMNTKASSVHELVNGTVDPNPYVYKEFKPESMNSFELGYKGLLSKNLLVDAYAYFGKYQDFLGRNLLLQPSSGKLYSTVINSSNAVNTHGFGLGFDYKLPSNFSTFVNLYSDIITNVPTGFRAFFNSPDFRINAGLANNGIDKKQHIGFNIVFHWQDSFNWERELANGPLPAFSTTDAQVNYKFNKIKSMVKLGGTNIFNQYYQNAFGNPKIGGLYYVSLAYNIL